MISLNATVTKGEGSASGQTKNWNGYGSIYHQINFLKQDYSEFSKNFVTCKMATINLVLDKPLLIHSWEYTFDKVTWIPGINWFEKISFSPIIFVFNNKQIGAWLYKAYKSPHKNNNCLFEVIAPYIDNLNCGDVCEIKIEKKYL
jgi:hypothetical protein